MINHLLGQYNDKRTFIHSLDPRLKIIFMAIFSSVLVITNNYYKLIYASIFIVLLLFLSRVRLSHLIYAMKSIAFIYLFVIVMYYFFSPKSIVYGFISFWRFTLLVFIGLILTSTTTLSKLVNGIEGILFPLKYVRIIKKPSLKRQGFFKPQNWLSYMALKPRYVPILSNPRNIALLLSITIRFVPLFFLYGNRVKDAQESRLSRLKKLSHINLFIKKLIDRMIVSADTLSDAIISRVYDVNSTEHTNFREMRFGVRDYIAVVVGIVFVLVFYLFHGVPR